MANFINDDVITMAHGSGGQAGHDLMEQILLPAFDYCEPHTCDFNHELGKQNSQRI